MNTEAGLPAFGGATEPDAGEGEHSLDLFTRFTDAVAHDTGTSRVFVGATAIMLIWLASGPLFHFSDTGSSW